jgi:hypothetical protein
MSSDQHHPGVVVILPIGGLLLGACLGALTTGVNAVVSPEYYR